MGAVLAAAAVAGIGRGTETGAVLAAAAAAGVKGGAAEMGAVLAATAVAGIGRGAEMGGVLAATAVAGIGRGTETGAVLAAAAAAGVKGGGAEMGGVLAATAVTGVGRGGTETGAILAATADVGVGGSGTETLLATTTGLGAGTNALGESRWDKKSILKPTPRAMEKRTVRTVPNGVLTAAAKVITQFVFLYTAPMTGGIRTNVLLSFFCSLISPHHQAAVVRLTRWPSQTLVRAVLKTNGFKLGAAAHRL
jgi:hypothetical protein